MRDFAGMCKILLDKALVISLVNCIDLWFSSCQSQRGVCACKVVPRNSKTMASLLASSLLVSHSLRLPGLVEDFWPPSLSLIHSLWLCSLQSMNVYKCKYSEIAMTWSYVFSLLFVPSFLLLNLLAKP